VVAASGLALGTAARRSRARRRVLIVSTDPAHSLGDALGVRLSGRPTRVRRSLDAVELERAMQVQDAGRELGLSGAPTLRELAGLTPAPWDGIFAEHRRALLALASEIDNITKSNRDLLQRGHQAAREALVAIGEIDIDAYDARGSLPDRSLALRIVDEAI